MCGGLSGKAPQGCAGLHCVEMLPWGGGVRGMEGGDQPSCSHWCLALSTPSLIPTTAPGLILISLFDG